MRFTDCFFLRHYCYYSYSYSYYIHGTLCGVWKHPASNEINEATPQEVCGGRRRSSRKNRITVLSPSLCIFLQYLQAATCALTRRIRVHGLSTQASKRAHVCVCIGVPHILDYLFSFYSDLPSNRLCWCHPKFRCGSFASIISRLLSVCWIIISRVESSRTRISLSLFLLNRYFHFYFSHFICRFDWLFLIQSQSRKLRPV